MTLARAPPAELLTSQPTADPMFFIPSPLT